MKYTADDIDKIYKNNKIKLPIKNDLISSKKPVESVVKIKTTKPLTPFNTTLPTKTQEKASLIDKIKQPIDNFKANYNLGKLSEKENLAWSEYRKNQSEESLKKAQDFTDNKDKFVKQNNVGQGNIVTKDFAQYVPQMFGQIGKGLQGAGNTALKGAGVGASTALIAGQMGPQVLAPEEIVTVPAGAVTGAVVGGKAGYMKGVAEYSYENMAGAAYKSLLDLGVPNEIALKASGDEALVNSLIEAAGAGVDIATLGIGKLFSKGTTTAAEKVVKNKLVSALKAYGINVASEGLEEGLQEKVSIENEKKSMNQAGLQRTASKQEDLKRIIDSAKGGAAIALVSGGGNAIGNIAVNTINNRQLENNQLSNNVNEQINSVKTQNTASNTERFIPKIKSIIKSKVEDTNSTKENINVEEINNIPKEQTEKPISTSSKAVKYQNRQENYFINNVADSLGISKYADRKSLKNSVNELTEELKNNTEGDLTEKVDSLFKKILDEGIQVDYGFYNQYRDLKSKIKNSKLFISNQVKNDFEKGEFNNFRRTNLGNLTLTNDKNAMQIDSYYQELSETNPELFPEDIINPSDQLKQIADVQNSIVKTENDLSLYADSNAEYTEWAKNDFDKAIGKLAMEARQVKKVQDEKIVKEETKAVDKEMVKNSTAEDMRQIHNMKKQYQKQYDKVMRNEILTDRDKVYVDRLVKGEIKVEDLPEGVNKGGIIHVYKAKEPLNNINKSIKEYNLAHKQFLRDEADVLSKNSETWKEKKSGFRYQRETMERNIRDIVPNKAEANNIINTYFTSVHENEAKSVKLKNEMRDKVKKLNLSDKEKYKITYGDAINNTTKTVSERTLVQLLGENLVDKGQIKNSGADVNKIQNAVNEFRIIYDELIKQSNDVLIENGYSPVEYRKEYFPHFQEEQADNMLSKLGRLVGLDVNTKELPTDIAGLTHTFKPGKKWVGNFLQRTTNETEFDAVEGFDRYIEGVSDVINHTSDIQRLRALEDSIRYTHSSDGIKAEIDKVRENESLADEDKQARIEELYQIDKNKFPYLVTELRSYTDNLAGKKSINDRNMEHRLGRGMYEISKAMENRVASNMVALNPGSWLTNFIPLTQGLGGLKTKNLLNGMKDTIANHGKNDGFVEKSAFLTSRRGSEPLVMTKIQNASRKLSSPMQMIDDFTSQSLVRARYYENMNKNMSETEAIREANKWTAGVMADRSKGSVPTLFNEKNPVAKTMTMFQLEVNNQLSYYFKDVPDELKEKGITALAMAFTKIFIGSWLYNQLYEKLTGRRAALDPIDIIATAVGDLTNKDKSTYDAVSSTATNLIEEVPFIGGLIGGGRLPISSAIPNLANTVKAATGLATGEMPTNKALKTLGKEVAKPATYLLAPFGGGQVKKAIEGINTVNKGGSFGVDSQGRDTLQFPADKTLGNYAKSTVFGKYSLPKAQDYIDSGFKSLSGPYTEKYKDALSKGFKSEEFLNTYVAQKRAQSEKDSKGETIYLSLAKNKKRAIDEANKGMSKEKLEQLYVYFDVSEKVWKEEEKKNVLPTIGSKIKFNSTLPTIKDKKE